MYSLIEFFRGQTIFEKPAIAKAYQKIEKAKEQIVNGYSIRRLELNNLGLTSEDLAQLIPIIAQELQELKELSLGGNNITFLPDSISRLPNLEVLNLENNNIAIVSNSILDCISIRVLNLENNAVEILPEDIDLLLNLKILNLRNNAIESLSENKRALRALNLDSVNLSENPLSLLAIFEISSMNKGLNVFILSKDSQFLLNVILFKHSNFCPVAHPIMKSVLNTYPSISEKEFTPFLHVLLDTAPEQVRGIVEFDFPLPILGIGLDKKGKLSNELDIDISLSNQLLDEIAEMKKEIDGTSIEVFTMRKVFYFDLDESQIDQISSLELMDSISKKIVEEIKETNYRDTNRKMMLDKLTEEDKALARATFNEIYQGLNLQQAKDKGAIQQKDVEQDNTSLDSSSLDPIIGMVVTMVQPINSEKKQEEQKRIASEIKNNFGLKPAAFNHKI